MMIASALECAGEFHAHIVGTFDHGSKSFCEGFLG
jgi:hypothetical protein